MIKSGYTESKMPMVVLIAPYPKLKQIADSMTDRYTVAIRTVIGDPGGGLALGHNALPEDYAILVDRGSTAKVFRGMVDVDVNEIGVSYLDLVNYL